MMLLASAFFSLMFALVKGLGPTFPFAEVVLFRALFGMPIVLVLMHKDRTRFWPRRPGLMALRGGLGFLAILCYFFALQRGVLADMAAIGRVQPFLITLLAPVLVGDRVSRRSLMALFLGLSGALLVIRPGFGVFDSAGLVALVGTLLSALAHLAVRQLKDHPPLQIVFYFTLIVGMGSGVVSLPSFVVPTGLQITMLIGLALCATFGQLFMTTAYSRDSAPVVAAATYSTVIYTLLLGLALWGEFPDPPSLLGAGLIMIAGIYLAFSRRGNDVPPSISA